MMIKKEERVEHKNSEKCIAYECIGINEKKSGTDMRCLKEGLIISALEGRLVLFPPLDVSKEEIDQATKIIKKQI